MTGDTATLALTPPFKAIVFERIDSTSEHAKSLAAEGAPSGTLVWAREQIAGHGRHGRAWSSPRGNLYLSAILRPAIDSARATEISFLAAVAVADCLAAYLPATARLTLKWPNDILVDGAKIAGILLEAEWDKTGRLEWVVVGIGVNIASHPSGLAYPATSLAAHGTGAPEVETLLAALSVSLAGWLGIWLEDGFQPIRARWLGLAHRLGEAVEIGSGHGIRGIFQDLDGDGALLLRIGNDVRRVTSGELRFSAA